MEAVHLAGLDHEDVARSALESSSADCPHSTAFADELDLVIRMAMRTRPGTGFSVEQEHRDTGAALLGSNKLMRTTKERQLLLAHMMHPHGPPAGLDECVCTQAAGMLASG